MLRRIIAEELMRRHGCGALTNKIKPVHIANGLFRETLGTVGKTTNLKQVMVYTAARSDDAKRERAMQKLLERTRDSWGRLADDALTRDGVLGRQVLPMLRLLMAADGAVYGESIDQSSLTTPTGSMVTSDPSDEHAGAFLQHLWATSPGGGSPSRILELLKSIIGPERDLNAADDLTVLFSPLAEGLRGKGPDEKARNCEDLKALQEGGVERDPVLWELRQAADLLAEYEIAAKPNPIATLERIVSLGTLTIFFYLATRGKVWAGQPRRPLLVQAAGKPTSQVGRASEQSVQQLIVTDVRYYLTSLLKHLFDSRGDWVELFHAGRLWQEIESLPGGRRDARGEKEIADIEDMLKQGDLAEDPDEALREIVDLVTEKEGNSYEDYLRLLGMRAGLLYPPQKAKKRVLLEDRVLEVLVAGTVNLVTENVEYQEFLERLWVRFGVITGGHPQDEFLLTQSGIPRVSSKYLRQNSDAFLLRLEEHGLAKRMADSKAIVGLLDTATFGV